MSSKYFQNCCSIQSRSAIDSCWRRFGHGLRCLWKSTCTRSRCPAKGAKYRASGQNSLQIQWCGCDSGQRRWWSRSNSKIENQRLKQQKLVEIRDALSYIVLGMIGNWYPFAVCRRCQNAADVERALNALEDGVFGAMVQHMRDAPRDPTAPWRHRLKVTQSLLSISLYKPNVFSNAFTE